MEMDLLVIYKFVRLPFLVLALSYIIFYVYNGKRRDRMEEPKYRMLEED
jgi:cbb3-type cytochrome oxidase subunit 3